MEDIYIGDDIDIEEMPQGCVITAKNSNNHVVISSTGDAIAVIQSLEKMLKCQLGVDVYKEKLDGK